MICFHEETPERRGLRSRTGEAVTAARVRRPQRSLAQAQIDAIPGWFAPVDQALFRCFLGFGGAGDVAEIGVYMGKSAALIGDHLRPSETFTVIDVFDAPAPNEENEKENQRTYSDLTRAAFEANYLRCHDELPVVIAAPSSVMLDHLRPESHRFVHVDGSHLYRQVADDLRAAARISKRGGIVAIDDFRSAHAPGVSLAAWQSVITGELTPVVASDHKLYCTLGSAPGWQDRLVASFTPLGLEWERQELADGELVRVWPTRAAPLRDRLLAAVPPALRRPIEVRRMRRGGFL